MKARYQAMKQLMCLLPLCLMLLSGQVYAQAKPGKKNFLVRQGDKAFDLFDFTGAVKYYERSLRKKSTDTVYVHQRMADAYRKLNDPVNAEQWYAKVVKESSDAQNVFWYAEMLRSNSKYEEARLQYQAFKTARPDDKNVDAILSGIDNLKELSKDKNIYRISNVMNINSAVSDFGPAYYKDGSIFFTSNKNSKRNNNLVDNWSTRYYYQVFTASPDSGAAEVSKVKFIKGKRPNGRFHDGPVTYHAGRGEIILTRSNYVKSKAKTAADKRTVVLKLFSMAFPKKKGDKLLSLPFNSNEYSNAHPSLSADGNTLYFSSDMPGGFGGTDLYVSTRSADGSWSTPQNLGAVINSKYDEKFPFIASDGSLWFASNALDGLGGLDLYVSRPQNGTWSKPENPGVPVNSNRDDFAMIWNSDLTTGYFTSNRAGGMGDDDIYSFTFDRRKLEYPVTVKVIDAVTKQPIEGAALKAACNLREQGEMITDDKGERTLMFPGGKSCLVNAAFEGYIENAAEVSPGDRETVVIIPLRKREIILVVSVKEKETMKPVLEAAIALSSNGLDMNYTTGSNGSFETVLAEGAYNISSPDYPSIVSSFNTSEAVNGRVVREFLIPRGEVVMNVPLTANCFKEPITVTDLKTGKQMTVAPNSFGETRLDLRTNSLYSIAHHGRIDTISTKGLMAGANLNGVCKFTVGQTWIIRNIYYDLDKANIRPDAAAELNHLVKVMNDNPTLEIELSSHTDCRQTKAYNNDLSARRALSAVSYLVSKGIAKKRMIAAGFGETKLTNDCACEPTNESPCSEEQHQANRRTEVKVLKY